MSNEMKTAFSRASRILIALAVLSGMIGLHARGAHAADSRKFPETGKTVAGRFLQYWDANGGLAQQGFPISDEMQEKSDNKASGRDIASSALARTSSRI